MHIIYILYNIYILYQFLPIDPLNAPHCSFKYYMGDTNVFQLKGFVIDWQDINMKTYQIQAETSGLKLLIVKNCFIWN